MNGIPNDTPLPDPTLRRILDALRALVRELRLASTATERQHGLSSAQLFVLHALRSRGKLSLGEVARSTLTDQSSVSVVVRKLEERGLVVKVPARDDRRRLEIDLSPDGRELLAQAPPPVQGALIQRLEALGARESALLADLLEAIVPPSGEAPPMFFEEPAGPGAKRLPRRGTGA